MAFSSRWVALAAHAVLFSLVVGVPGAITINVPDDVPTIAAAVGVASNGDTILVASGEYTESEIQVTSLSVTIEAASPEDTVWNVSGAYGLLAYSGSNVTVRGFVIQGATSSAVGPGFGGIMTVENCTLQNNGRNGASAGGGTATLTVRNCLIQDNPPGGTTLSHGGIRIDNSGVTALFEDNIIISDKVGPNAYGIGANDGSQFTARRNVIIGPTDAFISNNSGTDIYLSDNIIVDCTRCIRSSGGNVFAGDLSNVDTTDDGGNVFFADCDTFYERSSGGTFIAEGNLYPRIDSSYLSSRVTGTVDYSPALHVVIDRVSLTPHPIFYDSPIPDGQFIELRAVSDVPADHTLDISGWLVSDDPDFAAGDEGLFTFPSGTGIDVGESVLLAYNPAAIEEAWSIAPGAQVFDLNLASPEITLNPASDEVFVTPDPIGIHDALLFGAVDDTVDFTVWLSSRVAVTGIEGSVLARDLDSSDTNTAVDWTENFFSGRVVVTPVREWRIYR